MEEDWTKPNLSLSLKAAVSTLKIGGDLFFLLKSRTLLISYSPGAFINDSNFLALSILMV